MFLLLDLAQAGAGLVIGLALAVLSFPVRASWSRSVRPAIPSFRAQP